jgi:hypothetical protein
MKSKTPGTLRKNDLKATLKFYELVATKPTTKYTFHRVVLWYFNVIFYNQFISLNSSEF